MPVSPSGLAHLEAVPENKEFDLLHAGYYHTIAYDYH